MQSVRSSNLLNPGSALKALQSILQALSDRGQLQAFRELAQSGTRSKEWVEFPPFDLFTAGNGGEAPYRWFLPKPSVGVAQFLGIYEEFVGAPTGHVAAAIYTNQKSRRLLAHFNRPDHWQSAALVLAAAAQWLGAELEEHSTAREVRLRFGNGLIEVTDAGCWSNQQRAIRPVEVRQLSVGWPMRPFPATVGRGAVLHAFSKFSETLGGSAQYAATTLALALQEEVVTEQDLRVAVLDGSSSIMRATRRSPDKLEAAQVALAQCADILAFCEEGVVQALYNAAVPRLMNSRRFRATFGVPSQADPLREVRADTRAKWQETLEESYEELLNAKC